MSRIAKGWPSSSDRGSPIGPRRRVAATPSWPGASPISAWTWLWWWRGASRPASTRWPATTGCRSSKPPRWSPAGVGLWLELVESPPFSPRLARPKRIALAAVDMWTIWVTAYLVGLSHASVYPSYAHVAGRDLSVSADQALTTGILWLASLCAFIPVIFSNLVRWLRSDEDPDDALYRLVRDQRRGATEHPLDEHPDRGRPPG